MGHFAGESAVTMASRAAAAARKAVLDMGEELLLRPPEDVVREVVEAHTLHVPVLHRDRMTMEQPEDVRLAQPYLDRPLRVTFSIPFDGQPGLFDLRPSQLLIVPFEGKVRGQELRVTVEQVKPTKESLERERNKVIDQYLHELDVMRHDLRNHNDTLPQTVGDLVTSRREKLLGDRNLVASLDVPVRRREDAVLPVTVTRRIGVTRPSAPPSERFQPEWEIKPQVYQAILTCTRSMGIVMERAPKLFAGLDEEDIRDFFLAQLNAVFQGDAMAEVFNSAGKTDILIRWDERNVFIAECKVWRGAAKLKEAIDQLLGYLGWRDTRCAILLFVHERSVTDIVDKADEALKKHGNFKRMADTGSGQLERRYVFHWPGDTRQELTLALQVFAVPEPEQT